MSQPFLSRAGSLRGWGLPADCTRLTILRLYNSSSSRIQDSYNLRQSMLRLSEKGQWNEAVQLVQRNTKHNDQSYLPVWSSLVVEAFRAGKNATALSIWAQVCGFSF